MACESWIGKLDTYLDGELSAADSAALEAHLRGCPACAAQVLSRVQMKRAIKVAGKRYTPSADFRARMRGQLSPKPAVRWRFAWALPAAAFALLLATVLITGVSDRHSRQQTLISELADLHVSTLASATPVDVISTDRHTVKPWFQGRIPFSFNLPELQNSGFQLLGGRVTYLAQVPGAHLIYQLRKHEISVFIFPEQALPANFTMDQPRDRLSFHLVSFTQGGLRYFVLGDVSPTDLNALATLLRSAAS
jgi:anti-sigma factor RsiW